MTTNKRPAWVGEVEELLRIQGRRKDWLAEQLGIDPDYLSHFLSGNRVLSVERRHRLAQILGVKYAMIFGEEPQQEVPN